MRVPQRKYWLFDSSSSSNGSVREGIEVITEGKASGGGAHASDDDAEEEEAEEILTSKAKAALAQR